MKFRSKRHKKRTGRGNNISNIMFKIDQYSYFADEIIEKEKGLK